MIHSTLSPKRSSILKLELNAHSNCACPKAIPNMAFCNAISEPFRKSLISRPRICTSPLRRTKPRRTRVLSAPNFVSMTLSTPIFNHFTQAVGVNGVLFIAAKVKGQNMLTSDGLVAAFLLGILLWTCLSWQGYILCLSFLVFGSTVTKIGREKKEALGIAEKRGGARGPENIIGAAGIAALCAICALIADYLSKTNPNLQILGKLYQFILVGYTASIATKMSDTTASEVGKAYGSTTYLVTSFQRVPKGTEGAVSLEGTLAGAFASILAGLYGLGVGLLTTWGDVGVVVIAAFIATTAESFIGAAIQEKYEWSNEFVNFVNTAIGAIAAVTLCWLLGSI